MFEGIPDPVCNNPSGRGKILIGIVAIVVAAGVLRLLVFTPEYVPWVISGGKLQIHARFIWSQDYPVCDLQTSEAQIVELNRDPEWLPGKKIFGVNAPNYDAGDFYLRNGKEVELALAKESVAVILPREGKVPVMIGVTDAAAFLSALRAACPSSPRS
ncbi:MAG TPA: hypothetical protein VHC90_02360 [Bryobacteraceae bacterium]|nr:hypothetical protein [Bryobacteraceae bacterium]